MIPGPSPSPTNEPVDVNAGVVDDVLQALNGPPDHLHNDLPDLLLQEFNPAADNPNPLPLNDQPLIPPNNDLDEADDLEIIQILLQGPIEPVNLDGLNLIPPSPDNNYVVLHPVDNQPVDIGDLHVHLQEEDFFPEGVFNLPVLELDPELDLPQNDPDANLAPDRPSEQDLIQLEYQLALTAEASESQENRRTFEEQRHGLNRAQLQKLKENKLPLAPQAAPTVNQVIHLASHAILGDRRLPCDQLYQDIDITKIRDIVAQGNFTDLAHTNCPTSRCRKCFQTYIDLPSHVSQGQFAEGHEFDRLPPHISRALLITTTLEAATWDEIMTRYSPETIYFYPFNTEKISNRQLKELKNTGENVPATLELALQSAAPIAVCGEHQAIFRSTASLVFHLIMFPHVEYESFCSSCRAIFPTSALQHFVDFHDLDFPRTAEFPNTYEISKIISGKIGEDMLEVFNRTQLHTIDRHAYNAPLYSTVASLRLNLTHRHKSTYERLKSMLPDLSIADDLNFNTDTWDKLILQLLSIRAGPNTIIEVHKLISQVLLKLPPPTDAATTLTTLNYEVVMTIISAKLNFLYRGSELVPNYADFETRIDAPIGLHPTGAHPLAKAPQRLLDNYDTNFDAMTLGTNILLRSGIHVQQAIRVLNLSHSAKLLHATASYPGLMGFPDESGKWIQVPADQGVLNTVEKIMENPNRKTLIILEFNIGTNLQHIPANKWKMYVKEHMEDYALHFFISLRASRIKTACAHPIIVIGQGPIFSTTLDLEETTKLTEYITRVLLKASSYTDIPFLPTPGLIGFSKGSSVPLTTAPRGPVFNDRGELSYYSVQQAVRIVQTCVSSNILKDDCLKPPGFRFHMVR